MPRLIDIVIASARSMLIEELARLLPSTLFRVLAVQSFEIAEHHLRDNPPSVLLCDAQLIGGSGLELCQTLMAVQAPIRLLMAPVGSAVPKRHHAETGDLIYHDVIDLPTTTARLVDTVVRWLDNPQSTPDPRTVEGVDGVTPPPLSAQEEQAHTKDFNRSFLTPRLHTGKAHRSLKAQRAARNRLETADSEGAITQVERPSTPVPRSERTPRFCPARLISQERFIEEIERRHAALPSQDYWTLLGLESGATQEKIDAAYEHLGRHFEPGRHRSLRDPINKRRLRELHHMLQEAHHVLSDPTRRELYEAQRRRGALRYRPGDKTRGRFNG